MPALSCRFFKNRFPQVEDVVMVNVRSIAEMGAYVDLSEYNNIEGALSAARASPFAWRSAVGISSNPFCRCVLPP